MHLVPALDLEQSDYNVFGDDRPDRQVEVRTIRTLVLPAAVLKGHDTIRPLHRVRLPRAFTVLMP